MPWHLAKGGPGPRVTLELSMRTTCNGTAESSPAPGAARAHKVERRRVISDADAAQVHPRVAAVALQHVLPVVIARTAAA